MKATRTALRKYLLQEFVYKKEIHEGNSRNTQVIGCGHKFQLSLSTLKEWDKAKLPAPPKPTTIYVIPLFDRTMPSYWENIRTFLVDITCGGTFTEGFSLRVFPRPAKSHAPPIVKKNAWQRWRQQRPPWPWRFPFPTRLHGGDLENYNVFQRVFPYFRPKADPTYDKQRIEQLIPQMYKINRGYEGEVVAVMYHYRFSPIIAELLENEGYKSVRQHEFIAGTTANESFSKAMECLIKDADNCWVKTP